MKIDNMRRGEWGKVRAFFDVISDEGFIMKGFKLIEGINGLFASMPSRKGTDDQGNDKYYDIIWIESREMREKLNQKAIEDYQNKSETLSPRSEAASNQDPIETDEGTKGDSVEEANNNVEKVSAQSETFGDDDIPF